VKRILAVVTFVAVMAVVVSGAANARSTFGPPRPFGHTALQPAAATINLLSSAAGVSVGVIGPAGAAADGIDFPITNPLLDAAFSGNINHCGGLSLTQGSSGTVVDLTNFVVNLRTRTLYATVSTGAETSVANCSTADSTVPILNLDFSGARLGIFGGLNLGPVTASLTTTAETALDSAFGLGDALTSLPQPVVLGQVTVSYNRIF
jgi:hypothetical protein